ncbi:MBL fold metallo-hydrolase [uncultured Enterovirga sp.]|uniref:MBL fold metallo-hydrolase n=1 Tax=uncultured Enterovirga sp. TaxID=2026352 RepID=UPI0035CAFEEC
MIRTLVTALMALVALAGWGAPAFAAEESCPGLVARRSLPIIPASLAADQIELTYIGHSTFLFETAGGTRIATDYNDYVRPSVTPDIVTMNRAHSTHYSNNPEPGIRQILRGWNPAGGPACHDVQTADVRIRNIVTNIRQWGGDATIPDGNSIFVFETADLCIAHLGHLHHTLTPEHLKQLGRIDVLLVPVDGSYTLDLDGMMEVLASINPRLAIPMHFFGPSTLNRFLARAEGQGFTVERRTSPTLTLSRATLPGTPRVMVLPGH